MANVVRERQGIDWNAHYPSCVPNRPGGGQSCGFFLKRSQASCALRPAFFQNSGFNFLRPDFHGAETRVCGVRSAPAISLAGGAGRLGRNKGQGDAPLKDPLVPLVTQAPSAQHGVFHRTLPVGIVRPTSVHRGTHYPATGQWHDINATDRMGQSVRDQPIARHSGLDCRHVFVHQGAFRSSLLLAGVRRGLVDLSRQSIEPGGLARLHVHARMARSLGHKSRVWLTPRSQCAAHQARASQHCNHRFHRDTPMMEQRPQGRCRQT